LYWLYAEESYPRYELLFLIGLAAGLMASVGTALASQEAVRVRHI
jgi:hypothetical protein